MSRDNNGVYTVPNGTDATSGNTISSTAYNALLRDIETAFTDSLSRSGKGGLLAALTFEDGTANSPALAFTDEATSGIYRAAAGEINVSIQGVKVLSVKAAGIYSEVPHYQLVGASYAACTDVSDDFDIAGAWDFQGGLTVNSGVVLSHNDTNLTSGKIFVAQGSGPPSAGTGNNGDLYLYYT